MPGLAHDPDANDVAARDPKAAFRRPERAAAYPSPVSDAGIADIRGLQRRIGNRATARLLAGRDSAPAPPATFGGTAILRARGARAQRALPDGNTYRELDDTDVALVTVGTRVNAYNQVANPGNANEYQLAFTRLQAVDRAIDAWFETVSVAHEKLADSPHNTAVQTLASASEREHERLIQASKDMVNVLPFDTTGMQEEDIAALRTLWQDVVNSRGKIKLVGSETHTQRVLGELARMLSTSTGRAMLTFLNTAPDGEEEESAEALLTNIYIGESKEQLPEDVKTASPDVETSDVSKAQPIGVSETSETKKLKDMVEVTVTDIDPKSPPDRTRFPEIDAENLDGIRDAILAGLDGFTSGKKQYAFKRDRGTGAFVTSKPGLAVHGRPDTEHQIFSPGWVTLAHELSHALHFRAGAATQQEAYELLDTLTGTTDANKIGTTRRSSARSPHTRMPFAGRRGSPSGSRTGRRRG